MTTFTAFDAHVYSPEWRIYIYWQGRSIAKVQIRGTTPQFEPYDSTDVQGQ